MQNWLIQIIYFELVKISFSLKFEKVLKQVEKISSQGEKYNKLKEFYSSKVIENYLGSLYFYNECFLELDIKFNIFDNFKFGDIKKINNDNYNCKSITLAVSNKTIYQEFNLKETQYDIFKNKKKYLTKTLLKMLKFNQKDIHMIININSLMIESITNLEDRYTLKVNYLKIRL